MKHATVIVAALLCSSFAGRTAAFDVCPGCEWSPATPTTNPGNGSCGLGVMMIVTGEDGVCFKPNPTADCQEEDGCDITMTARYTSLCSNNVVVINCGGAGTVTLTGLGPALQFKGVGWRRDDTLACGVSINCTATLTNSSSPGEVATGTDGGTCEPCDEDC